MTCCAVGPCDRSRQRGGPGCYLCDEVARLPPNARPVFRPDVLFGPTAVAPPPRLQLPPVEEEEW